MSEMSACSVSILEYEQITNNVGGMKNRGLPLTLVKMGIYGGICANMAEYVQKVAKLCKPGAKLGDPWGSALFVSYRFLPQNSRVLTAGWDGGMKFYKSKGWCHSFGS